MTTYNNGKLIRDLLPDQIKKSGRKVRVTRIEDEVLLYNRLLEKLREEAQEVLEAKTKTETIEELADVLTVVYSIAELLGATFEDLHDTLADKRHRLGAFNEGHVLWWVEN